MTYIYTFPRGRYTATQVQELTPTQCKQALLNNDCDVLTISEFEWHFNNDCLPPTDSFYIKVVVE